MDKETALDKIKKLLRLSKSPNEHEAYVALMKAQELAAQHGVSLSELSGDSETVAEKDREGQYQILPVWFTYLASVICRNFRCEFIYKKGISGYKKYRSRYYIIGLESDAEIAENALNYAHGALKYLWKAYWKNYLEGRTNSRKPTDKMRKQLKDEYFNGFVYGLSYKFEKNAEKYDLIIVTPDAVTQYISHQHKKITENKTSLKIPTASEAFHQGYLDGKASKPENINTMIGVK